MRGSVLFIDAAASGTGSGRVAGINRYDRNTLQLRLVFDKRAELMEGPTMQCGSLAATKPDPMANTTQFFKGDTLFGAFRSFHNALADVVVYPGGKPLFFSRQFAQTALCRLCAFALQLRAQTTMAKANVVDLS